MGLVNSLAPSSLFADYFLVLWAVLANNWYCFKHGGGSVTWLREVSSDNYAENYNNEITANYNNNISPLSLTLQLTSQRD